MPPRPFPGLAFDNVRDKRLRDIWLDSDAFQKFRGTDWMREPCRSCEFREIDWGGCRCQAFAFAGDAAATDPACAQVLAARGVRARRRGGGRSCRRRTSSSAARAQARNMPTLAALRLLA